jgi:hypothetical protein
MTDTTAALDGMVTTRDITVIMHRITRIITGIIIRVITLAITRIIIPRSRHAGRAPRKNSTVTITITITTGGTSGNEKSRVRKQSAPLDICSLARVSRCADKWQFDAANNMNNKMYTFSSFTCYIF